MKLKHIVMVLLALLPALYLMAIWNTIPETVPTHFDIDGKPNGYSSRGGFLVIECILCLVNIGVYLLLVNIHKLDPKRVSAERSEVFDKLAIGLTVFLTAISAVTIMSSLHPKDKIVDKALVPLMGLMFVFLGNYMHNVKPNYFVGIRIPWTLHDEENWKKTHRLAGGIWFVGGLLIAIAGFFAPVKVAFIIMQAALAVMVIIPISYSYSLFRKQTNATNTKG